jgi:hypothetical protein
MWTVVCVLTIMHYSSLLGLAVNGVLSSNWPQESKNQCDGYTGAFLFNFEN